jgi:hypothetical protein
MVIKTPTKTTSPGSSSRSSKATTSRPRARSTPKRPASSRSSAPQILQKLRRWFAVSSSSTAYLELVGSALAAHTAYQFFPADINVSIAYGVASLAYLVGHFRFSWFAGQRKWKTHHEMATNYVCSISVFLLALTLVKAYLPKSHRALLLSWLLFLHHPVSMVLLTNPYAPAVALITVAFVMLTIFRASYYAKLVYAVSSLMGLYVGITTKPQLLAIIALGLGSQWCGTIGVVGGVFKWADLRLLLNIIALQLLACVLHTVSL